MSETIFYNRTDETAELVKIFEGSADNNRIIILAGKSAVGKSAFVDKVLKNELRSHDSFRVNICKSSSNTIENLHYINALYRALAELANQKKWDNIHSPLQRSVSSIRNLFSLGIDVLMDKTLGEGNTLHEPTDERSVLRKRDYIVSVLKKRHFIIAFDNIQCIDTQSLEILDDILKQVSNTALIFEYTVEDDGGFDESLSFFNTLARYNASRYFLLMKKLDFSEAKKLAPPSLDEEEILALYNRSDGNLVKIQLASRMMGINDDPITIRLTSLSKDQQFLMQLIYLNESPLHINMLQQMLIGNINAPPFSEVRINQCLCELKSKKMIKIFENNEIRVYHDSIIAQLEDQKPSVILYSAYAVIKEFYRQRIRPHSSGPSTRLWDPKFRVASK